MTNRCEYAWNAARASSADQAMARVALVTLESRPLRSGRLDHHAAERACGLLRCLEQVRTLLDTHARRIRDGERRALVGTGAGVLALLVDGVVLELEEWAALVVEETLFRHGDHAFHDLHQRL